MDLQNVCVLAAEVLCARQSVLVSPVGFSLNIKPFASPPKCFPCPPGGKYCLLVNVRQNIKFLLLLQQTHTCVQGFCTDGKWKIYKMNIRQQINNSCA